MARPALRHDVDKTRWRAMFDDLVARGWVYDAGTDSMVRHRDVRAYIRGWLAKSEKFRRKDSSEWNPSLTLISRWGAGAPVREEYQGELELIFWGPGGREASAECRAFQDAFNALPNFDAAPSRIASTTRRLLLAPLGKSLLHIPPHEADGLTSDRSFTRDLLGFVHQGAYRESPEIVGALAHMAARYENRGHREIADQLTAVPLGTLLRMKGSRDAWGDVMADLMHVCELRGRDDALSFVNASDSGVSPSRRMQEYACACCRHLRNFDLCRAEELLSVMEGNLGSCLPEVRAMFHLHRGRILLVVAAGAKSGSLAEAVVKFGQAEAAFAAASDEHPFLPHARAYKLLAMFLDTGNEHLGKQVRDACRAVEAGSIGESCLDPIGTANRYLGKMAGLPRPDFVV